MKQKQSHGENSRRSNVFTIMKKEFARFFGDKKLMITTLFLPGILIYVVYSFMGEGIASQFQSDGEEPAQVYVENMPESVRPVLEQLPIELMAAESGEDVKTGIQEKEKDLLVVFPEEFDSQVAAYDVQTSQAAAPEVQIYFNSSSTRSQTAYSMLREALDQYETALANKFDVNRPVEGESPFDLATQEDRTGQIFSMLLPLLLMVFLFSGCMAVVPESIAGEKERGTIATLLVTPMRRGELAVGKILSLSVIALLSGISSFAGTILSLPKLMGGAAEGVNAGVYQPLDYVLLLGLILSTILVITSLMAIISSYSKSVKEANTAVTPLMVLVMFLGVTSMLGGGASSSPLLYCIPLYNTVQSMVGIFSFEYSMTNVLIAMGVNLLCSGILAYAVTRLFNSEKVMFSR